MAENSQNTKAPILAPEQAQKLSQSGYLNPETAAMFEQQEEVENLPPATVENQQTTEKINEIYPKETMTYLTRTSRMSDVEAKRFLLEENRRKEELQAAKEIEQQQQQDQEASDLKQSLMVDRENLIKDIKYLQEKGLSDPTLEQKLAETDSQLSEFEVQQEDSTIAVDPLQDAEKNQQKIQAEDASDIQDTIELKKNSIMDQLSSAEAEMKAVDAQRQKLEDENNKIFSDIEDLKKQAKDTQVDDFWNTSSTGTKLMAALAIGLGAYQGTLSGTGGNNGLDMVNKIIDRELEQKQQGFKNQLALKSAVMDKVKSQLSILDSQTLSKDKKIKILTLKQQLEQEQSKIQQNLFQEQRKDSLQRISMNKELAPEVRERARQEIMRNTPEKLQEKLINLGDMGGVQTIIGTPGEAKDLREKVSNANMMVKDLHELSSLVSEVSGTEKLLGKVGLQSESYRRVEQITSSIIGMLRVDILGPGVMTEAERQIIKNTLGNPNKILTLDDTEKKMIFNMQQKIYQGTRDRLRKSGVELPPSANEITLKNIEAEARKRGEKFNRAEVISKMMEKNVWQVESFE
jgi:hypothetical protein